MLHCLFLERGYFAAEAVGKKQVKKTEMPHKSVIVSSGTFFCTPSVVVAMLMCMTVVLNWLITFLIVLIWQPLFPQTCVQKNFADETAPLL